MNTILVSTQSKYNSDTLKHSKSKFQLWLGDVHDLILHFDRFVANMLYI